MRSLSTYVIILPLIGVAAFYIDSSFLSFRTFLNVFDPGYVDTVFEINSIVCVIAVIGILYIINRSKDENAAADSGPTRLYNKILIITQSVIIFVILITLFQLDQTGTYSFANIVVLFSISYGIGFFFIALMALRFFAWFRHGRELMVLSYGLTMCIFIAFLGTSIIYALYEFSTSIYPKLTSRDIAVQVSGKNSYPNFYDTYFYYTYLATFISIYLITTFSLRAHLKKMKPAAFYLLLGIPLIYFLIIKVPFFLEYFTSLIVSSPSFYGMLYIILFSGTGPLGGVLFSLVLFTFSRRVESAVVRRYLLISALGMLLFFTINQYPPLQESLIPPFGVVSKSFVGLSCYMIFIGIYTTVIYLSRRNTLTNIVLKELSTDRLFGSFVRSEQEIQIKEIIRQNMDHIKTFQEVKAEDLSKEEISELVNIVKKEISKRKNSAG